MTVTTKARERFELAYGGYVLRWSLTLDLMELLARQPELAETVTRELLAFEAG